MKAQSFLFYDGMRLPGAQEHKISIGIEGWMARVRSYGQMIFTSFKTCGLYNFFILTLNTSNAHLLNKDKEME